MIELGLVMLVKASVPGNGGYCAQIPEGTTLPAWSYTWVSDVSDVTLTSPESLTRARVQIDCFANTPGDAFTLAGAISRALHGFVGFLSDPDSTNVQECLQRNKQIFFDEESRSYRVMLEYQLWYVAN